MKNVPLVIFLFLLCQNSFCQEKKLSIENHVSNKEILIKENRMIKVITKTGEKFVGRFMILNQNTISIDGVILDLSEIDLIRKYPLSLAILIKANFFHMGTVGFLLSLVFGSLPIALLGVINLAGGIYSGITFPNISEGYRPENNWTFKIKGLTESNITSNKMPIIQ